MTQYIGKNEIKEEIDRRIKVLQNHPKENHKTICHLDSVKQFLDTLEVKDVDLEKEFFDWHHEEKNRDYNASILYERYSTTSKKLAKHFFELGLKAQKGK